MGLTFNAILEDYGLRPGDVRLLRHQTGAHRGTTLYGLWRDDREAFVTYQSIQTSQNRSRLASPYWASFVVTPARSVMFVGVYEVELIGSCPPDAVDPFTGGPAGGLDHYRQALVGESAGDIGRVFIDWGSASRVWSQSAANQPKPIVENTQAFREDAFPGYTRFIAKLSDLGNCPAGDLPPLAPPGAFICSHARGRRNSMSVRHTATTAFLAAGLHPCGTDMAATSPSGAEIRPLSGVDSRGEWIRRVHRRDHRGRAALEGEAAEPRNGSEPQPNECRIATGSAVEGRLSRVRPSSNQPRSSVRRFLAT